MKKNDREFRYKQIIAQMPDESDFLLTHYHDDHYAGAIYMGGIGKRFRNVYIPDIWNTSSSVDIIKLVLLRGLITRSVLRRGLSLIRFLISICALAGKVFFIKRTSNIQDKYVALWPEQGYVEGKAKEIISGLSGEMRMPEGLTSIAERLREIVLRLEVTERLEERSELIRGLENLEREYTALSTEITIDKNLQYKLSCYGNGISIVFQNKYEVDRNILFTGDAGKESIWDFIEKNSDGKVSMYDRYDVIKIPHHGTTSYYHSFVSRCGKDTQLLIPNGKIANSSWYIDRQYSADANVMNCFSVCSNNKACAASTVSCSCHNYILANNPNHYVDI